uniref:Matrix-remodeling-associated protein 7 n=1 Tax=Heterorhabditis bacteriophora TaxID=37862 RepID=A0A1I7W702_HETBA
MTSKVANGSGMGAPRPPFRRQGSSSAGVHPMTVALPPVQKVDYSVTKVRLRCLCLLHNHILTSNYKLYTKYLYYLFFVGGARTWAVLLVFMFLCSSLYTVFSTKEAKELAVDADISEDQDDLPGQHHKNMRDTAPEDYRRVTHKSYEETSDQYNIQTDVKLTDADDEAEQDSGLEHQLFAGLRKKIEKNMQRAKDIIVKKELEQLMTDNGKKEEEEHIYVREVKLLFSLRSKKYI